MSLQFSAAHSSRITKPRNKNAFLKRSASSPFASLTRRKPVQRSKSKPETLDDDDLFGDRSDDHGLATNLTTDLSLRDVAQAITHARDQMFDTLPERGGFNSVRIAEVLNFRKSLPPTVTVAHVHGLLQNATAAEREIAELSRKGVLRKIVIPGRGTGGSSVSEGVVLSGDLEGEVKNAVRDGLEAKIADEFLSYLHANPLATTLPSKVFCPSSVTALRHAGFLTSSALPLHRTNSFTHSTTTNRKTSIPSISRAPSGSLAAIGGSNAIHEAGGSGTASGLRRSSSSAEPTTSLQISLPNTGPYLRLLTAARAHLVSLLQKSRSKEIPLDMLRERWDGGVAADGQASKRKQYRGEWKGVLPAKTKKWREFYGLRFEWVLEEALGSGLVEGFETGSVGMGVRYV